MRIWPRVAWEMCWTRDSRRRGLRSGNTVSMSWHGSLWRGEERVVLLFITVEWKRLLLLEAAALNLPLNEDRPFKVSDAWQPVAYLSRKQRKIPDQLTRA